MSSPDPRVSLPRAGLSLLFLLGFTLVAAACDSNANGVPDGLAVTQTAPSPDIDGERLLRDLSILAHDSMEGRRAGTAGAERARRFLVDAFRDRGLQPLEGGWTHSFRFTGRGEAGEIEGVNVLGWIEGSEHPDRFIVVTAHYDHLGVRDGEIFNGADDNGSGTAGILALARYFSDHPPRHSLVFAALDAEEMGLQGARAFLADPPVPIGSIMINVNLDMVSRSDAGELYASGTYHYPFLVPWVEEVAARAGITLLMGHDSPDLPPGDDWTMSSDHGPFHQSGVPFLYFGVEDHPGYHNPMDIFEDITPAFYIQAVTTVRDFIRVADREGIQ